MVSPGVVFVLPSRRLTALPFVCYRTPSLFFTPELALSSILTASGQSVGKWVLNEAERKVHDKMPVIWDFEDGCYVFPPTKGKREDGGAVVKAAIHHRTSLQPHFRPLENFGG